MNLKFINSHLFRSNQDYSDPNFLPGSQYAAGNFVTPEFVGGIDLKDASQFEEVDVLEEYISGNYNATEKITGAYVMADQQINEKLSVIGGLRLEHTAIDYSGNIFDIDNETVSTTESSQSYTNLMPGLHFKYDTNENTVLRVAWTNTIARPNYYALVPYAAFSPEDEELERGNPNLKPTTAMNFDLMAERYFENVGLISGGAFYKDIDSFIYNITTQGYSDPQFGDDLEFTRPENGGTATVYGFETSFQRQVLKNFGIYLNYTFTKSNTTGIEGRESEDLELPGTASHTFNASLSFENKRWVVRVSLNYALTIWMN